MKTVHQNVEETVINWLETPLKEVPTHVVKVTHEFLIRPEVYDIHLKTNLASESLHLLSAYIQFLAAEMSRKDSYDMEVSEYVDILVPFVESKGYYIEVIPNNTTEDHTLDMLDDWENRSMEETLEIKEFNESEMLTEAIDKLLFMKEGN